MEIEDLFSVELCLPRSATSALIFVDIDSMVDATSRSTIGDAGAELSLLSSKS
jgi:hypothetical protein